MNNVTKQLRGPASYRAVIMGNWADLALPRFKCGHEKTQANSYVFDNKNRHGNIKQRLRCKFCHDKRAKDYRAKPKAKKLARARNRSFYVRHRESELAKRAKRYQERRAQF